MVDELDAAYAQVKASDQPVPGDLADRAVYYYYPPLERVWAWIDQARPVIEEEGAGSELHHFLVRKR